MSFGHFSGQHFNGLSEGTGGVNPCARPTYASRSDVELLFGADNVAKWADLNNNGVSSQITARVCWALAESYAYINNRLNGGPYEVPFTEVNDELRSMSARYAGVLLYDTRGITDMADEPSHQLTVHQKQVDAFIQRILAGRTKLVGVDYAAHCPEIVK